MGFSRSGNVDHGYLVKFMGLWNRAHVAMNYDIVDLYPLIHARSDTRYILLLFPSLPCYIRPCIVDIVNGC